MLADTAIRAKDLDEAASRKAKDEAERMLANRTDALEVAQAQGAACAGDGAVAGAGAVAAEHEALICSDTELEKPALPPAFFFASPARGRGRPQGG